MAGGLAEFVQVFEKFLAYLFVIEHAGTLRPDESVLGHRGKRRGLFGSKLPFALWHKQR